MVFQLEQLLIREFIIRFQTVFMALLKSSPGFAEEICCYHGIFEITVRYNLH